VQLQLYYSPTIKLSYSHCESAYDKYVINILRKMYRSDRLHQPHLECELVLSSTYRYPIAFIFMQNSFEEFRL